MSISPQVSDIANAEVLPRKEISHFKVTKSNDLVEAQYKLSLNEQRLLLVAMSFINSKDPLKGMELREGKTLVVHGQAFAKTFNIKPHTAYDTLKQASNKLYEREIRHINGPLHQRIRWVSSIKYHDGEGYAELNFSDEILPHLTLLGKKFTSYTLKQIVQLKNSYSIRIYELLKRVADLGERRITPEDLKQRLQLTTEYSRFYDLRKRVIDPAIKEINLYTDLEVEFTPEKRGRKIVNLLFTFRIKPQTEMDI